MALSSAGILTGATTASAAPYAAIRTGTNRFEITRIGLGVFSTTNACAVGLSRAVSQGTTPSGSTLLQAYAKTAQASLTNIDTAWGTPPTVLASYFRRDVIASVTGNGVIWTFTTPLIVEPNDSIILWNFGALSAGQLVLTVEGIE